MGLTTSKLTEKGKDMWKMELKREVCGVESRMVYSLPGDICVLLDDVHSIGEEYRGSVIEHACEHCLDMFAGQGFLPSDLLPPTSWLKKQEQNKKD